MEQRMDAKKLAVTVWKDGGWKVWGTVDAMYARDDPDWLCDFGVADVLASAERESADIVERNAG